MKANSRIRTLWNLTRTVGFAALVCVPICWGIYLGDRHREAVLSFERGVLGMKEDAGSSVSPAPSARPAPSAQPGQPPENESTAVETSESTRGAAAAARASTQTASPSSAPEHSVPVTDIDRFQQPPSPLQGVVPSDPIDTLKVPVTVKIKVLVDERYANLNVDWISLIQRTMSAAGQVYRDNLGIDISLAGVVKWNDALEGLDTDALYANLRRRPREGADILLGFLSDHLNAYGYLKGTPPADSPFNGAYGLVGITAGSDPPHLRGVLRSIGHLLGAQAIIDPNSEAYRLGTWMSDGPVIAGRVPWIDLENRKRILTHKGRPFLPEGEI